MDFVFHLIVIACIYIVLAVSLDLLIGQTGLMSVAQAAFYGVGAYTSVLMTLRLGSPFLLNLLCGMCAAALFSLAISIPTIRLQSEYFVITTLGFQLILSNIFSNWLSITGGPLGIPSIPHPAIYGLTIGSSARYAALAIFCAAFAWLATYAVSMSPFGRVLRAIREDEAFAQALGKNTVRFKVVSLSVSAALAALAGCLYAHYLAFIDPTSFTLSESILIICMVIIGGAGSRWGPVVGAIVLVALPELLRFVGLPTMVAANLRQMIYGVLLVLMMIFRPRGLVGKYGFGR